MHATTDYFKRMDPMSYLANKFGPCVPCEIPEDVAAYLRHLRSQGLLGTFLCDPEVLGDDSFYVQGRRDGTAETLREYCSRFGNGDGFVVRLERNCMSVTPLGPQKPCANRSGRGSSVESGR